MLLLGKFHISYFAYGIGLINALVIAKVILSFHPQPAPGLV